MLLNDTEIKAANLIEDGIDSHYRAISYDLGVGKIITIDGEEKTEFKLQPQGIVEVIARERIKLPHNIAAYAMVKTSLCNEGILPLNIGIVDPGYEGYISATLLNFGKKEFPLLADEVFLRLTFHKCSVSPARKDWPTPVSSEDYVKDKKKKVVNFAKTFLNLDSTVKQATKPLLDTVQNRAFIWIPIFALFMTALTFAVTLGVNFTTRGYWSKEDVKTEVEKELGIVKEKSMTEQIENLQKQIDDLKASQRPSNPAQSKNQTNSNSNVGN